MPKLGNQQSFGKREPLEEWYSQALVHFHEYAEARMQQMDPYTKINCNEFTSRRTTSLAQRSVLLVKENSTRLAELEIRSVGSQTSFEVGIRSVGSQSSLWV